MAKKVGAREHSEILEELPVGEDRSLTVIPGAESINTGVPPIGLGQPDTLVLVGYSQGHRWIAIYLSDQWRKVLFWSITSVIVGALALKGPALVTALQAALSDLPLR